MTTLKRKKSDNTWEVVNLGTSGTAPVITVLWRDTDIALDDGVAAPIGFETIYDDDINFNTILALPAGLGLSATVDGAHPTITATEAGTWLFELWAQFDTDDTAAVIIGPLGIGMNDAHLPDVKATTWQNDTPIALWVGMFTLPQGTTFPMFAKGTGMTSTPFHMTRAAVKITRLA